MLSNMNLCINYERVQRIKDAVVRKVRSKMAENDGVYIPSHLSPTNQVYFAIDNCDLKIDTPDGKDQLHGTAIAVFQEQDVNYMPLPIELDRSSKVSHGVQPLSIYPQQYCPEPVRKNKTYTSYKETLSSSETSMPKLLNNVYFLLKAMNISNKLPTWSAFNSIACCLPLIRGTPTDFSNLYSALLAADKVRTVVSPGGKTIITLDLQLYSKCIELQSKKEVSAKFVFRIGELHVVFAFLKAIGKYISNSG